MNGAHLKTYMRRKYNIILCAVQNLHAKRTVSLRAVTFHTEKLLNNKAQIINNLWRNIELDGAIPLLVDIKTAGYCGYINIKFKER